MISSDLRKPVAGVASVTFGASGIVVAWISLGQPDERLVLAWFCGVVAGGLVVHVW